MTTPKQNIQPKQNKMTHQLAAFKQIISRINPNVLKDINPHKGLSQIDICAKLELHRLLNQAGRVHSDFLTKDHIARISCWKLCVDALTELKNAMDEYVVWSICEQNQYDNLYWSFERKYPEIVDRIAELCSIYGTQPSGSLSLTSVVPIGPTGSLGPPGPTGSLGQRSQCPTKQIAIVVVPIGVKPVEKKPDDSIASRVRARRGERRPLR